MAHPKTRHTSPPLFSRRVRSLALLTLAPILWSCAAGPQAADSQQPNAAQRTAQQGDASDIPQPGFLRRYAQSYRFRLGEPGGITPLPDGKTLLFLRSGPRSFVRDLYALDLTTGQERVLLTAQSVLKGAEEQLTPEEKARRERARQTARGVATYRLTKDASKILIPLSGSLYVVDRATGAVQELPSDAGYPIDPRFSPDGSKIAVVREGDLYVMDVETGAERRLTTRENENVTNGLAEFVAQEEMGRFAGYWWSPDSRFLAYERADVTGVERLSVMDPTHPERPAPSPAYPRPGKKNADVQLGVIPVEGGETVWVSWDRARYPYLATVKWEENAPLTILVQNREQTEEALLAVDPATGSATPLLIERDDAWLNLDQSMPHWLPDGSAFLWTTERNGAWQLELRDRSGELLRVLVPVGFGFQGFAHYDKKRQEAVVYASEDPTQRHVWRVPIDPSLGGPRRMTTEPGLHSVSFHEDSPVHVHTFSGMDGSRRRVVVDENEQPLDVEIRSVAEEPGFAPNAQWTVVKGPQRDYHAVVLRPRNFVEGRRYPVILSVYGGPHTQMVTKSLRRYVFNQWIADHGYIVVSIDGRGTPSRGRAWERAIKGNLIEIPLHDQVEALTLLGKRFPEMDLSRVGVYGWSFGGYFSAHATMQRPDVFDAGVAGAPVADWRDYDTHYTERYMGLPDRNKAGYDAASVLTHAPELQKPLLIVHGTVDDNVYFMHSLKMADALFKAGKDFDFLPLAGFTHMVPDPLVTERLYSRIMDFFAAHLHPGE